MKIKRSILTVMLFAGLFLAACNTAPGTEIKPTDAATTPGLSGVATKPQMTVSTDAPPQISATPASTATPTPDASAVGEIVMVEEPTLDVESISKVVTAGTPEIEDLAVSTNGRWKITLVKFPCAEVPDLEGKYSLDRVEVTNVTAQTTATVDEQVMLCGGLGAHGYKNLGWGLGGTKYFFYKDAEGKPDGMAGDYLPPLMMFDAVEGATTKLGPGKPSADLSLIAYGDKGAPENNNVQSLKVINWNGDVLYDLPLDLPATGTANFTFDWAKGRNVLAFVETDCTETPCVSQAFFVDPAWNLPQNIVADFSPGLLKVSWVDGMTLHFIDEENKGWLYSFATGEITENTQH